MSEASPKAWCNSVAADDVVGVRLPAVGARVVANQSVAPGHAGPGLSQRPNAAHVVGADARADLVDAGEVRQSVLELADGEALIEARHAAPPHAARSPDRRSPKRCAGTR